MQRTVPSFTVLLGTALVLGLVAALPVALAVLPAETLQSGLGPGDLSAAALSSLDRDIQTHRVLTPDTSRVEPAFLNLHGPTDDDVARALQASSPTRDIRPPPPPGTCTPGPTDGRFLLLL